MRGALVRLEETIIFSLIERAQFLHNARVYEAGAFGNALDGLSLVGFLLRGTERLHAQLRRYTSPDEHPFFHDLPSPLLPGVHIQSSLAANTVNINARVRSVYEEKIVPHICRPGDDRQYGSSAVNDVGALQAISKRVHYGKFVAESKYRGAPATYRASISAADKEALNELITDRDVEHTVLQRVRHKARTYCRELASTDEHVPDPAVVVDIFRRWIIPLNKEVQVLYLLGR